MPHDTLTPLEYEALRAEERDRMNGRTQVWTLYLSVVGAFSFVVLQNSTSAALVALCPLLLACLARHCRHSEDALRIVRKYLYQLEVTNSYRGYEHFTREAVRKTHGGYRTALRDAFIVTDILATTSAIMRLYTDHAPLFVCGVVLLFDVVALVFTQAWLSKPRKPHGKKEPTLEGDTPSEHTN